MKKVTELMERRRQELESLRDENNLILAERVVEFAENPSTALHGWFEWDDSRAAHQHRLQQARQLIVWVKVKPAGSDEPIQAFASIESDRHRPGGGYRSVILILSDAALYQAYLAQAMEELQRFQQKYAEIKELGMIFSAARAVRRKLRSRAASARSSRAGKPSRKGALTTSK
jgi:hypothetical protein